jgi:hypothetical protein
MILFLKGLAECRTTHKTTLSEAVEHGGKIKDSKVSNENLKTHLQKIQVIKVV